MVIILDDAFLERDIESFTLRLKFFRFTRFSNVILSPNVSTIEILDNDCKILTTVIFAY
jgi:hypothetical protein